MLGSFHFAGMKESQQKRQNSHAQVRLDGSIPEQVSTWAQISSADFLFNIIISWQHKNNSNYSK